MGLALNDPQNLICHKIKINKQTKKPHLLVKFSKYSAGLATTYFNMKI